MRFLLCQKFHNQPKSKQSIKNKNSNGWDSVGISKRYNYIIQKSKSQRTQKNTNNAGAKQNKQQKEKDFQLYKEGMGGFDKKKEKRNVNFRCNLGNRRPNKNKKQTNHASTSQKLDFNNITKTPCTRYIVQGGIQKRKVKPIKTTQSGVLHYTIQRKNTKGRIRKPKNRGA